MNTRAAIRSGIIAGAMVASVGGCVLVMRDRHAVGDVFDGVVRCVGLLAVVWGLTLLACNCMGRGRHSGTGNVGEGAEGGQESALEGAGAVGGARAGSYKSVLIQQICALAFSSLILDGGVLLHAVEGAIAAYWGWMLVAWAMGPRVRTVLDSMLMKYGFWVLVVVMLFLPQLAWEFRHGVICGR